jgi:hypothetical protein
MSRKGDVMTYTEYRVLVQWEDGSTMQSTWHRTTRLGDAQFARDHFVPPAGRSAKSVLVQRREVTETPWEVVNDPQPA